MTYERTSRLSFRANSRYHTQDLIDSCGAAVAMTILALAGIPLDEMSQEVELANAKNAGKGTKFSMSPTAVVDLLNIKLEAIGKKERYQALYVDCPKACLRSSLVSARAGWPAVTLLWGYHWGLIDGYETDVSGKVVTAVWLHNPVENLPDGDGLPPHCSTDLCGSGGALGCAEELLVSSIWLDDYSWECEQLKKECGSYYVSIGVPAPLPPAEFEARTEPPSVSQQALASGLIEAAAEVFVEYETSLRQTHVGESIEVVPLDDRIAPYSLAALNTAEGRIFWIQTRGDDRTPLAVAKESTPQPPVVTVEEARLVAQALIPGALAGEVSSSFVWRLCPESYSPFLPFRKVRMSEGESVYVRSDGKGFLSLTEPILGG